MLLDAMTRFATTSPFDFNAATICATSAGHRVQPSAVSSPSKLHTYPRLRPREVDHVATVGFVAQHGNRDTRIRPAPG